MRMSMPGLSRWNSSMRGISHIDAKLAQVVMATLRRPAVWRTSRTAASMRSSAGQLHRAGVAQKQGHAHFFLQRLDLAAYGRLSERQFVGGGAEVQVFGHSEKGAPVPGGHGAGAKDGGGIFGRGHGRCPGGRFMR